MKSPVKSPLIVANPERGENVFHAWNGTRSFYVFTQRGKRGIDLAAALLAKEFGNIYLSICFCARKADIKFYF
jgi:hypothetical protein